MHHIIVDRVRLMVYDVVCVILVQLHLQISIDKCFSCAYFDVNLVSFLPLDIAISDKDFGCVFVSVPVLLLAILQTGSSQIVTFAIVIKVVVYAPVRLRLHSLIH